MDADAEAYTAQETHSFLRHHKATFKGFQLSKRIVTTTASEMEEAEGQLTDAEETVEQTSTRDPGAIAVPWWAELIVLAALATAEGFVNFLAAEGLLQDQTITWGVTLFLTVVLGCLAYILARDHRNRRRMERKGRFSDAPFLTEASVGATVVYLGLSLFLRWRYFKESDFGLRKALGPLVANPWFIASALTVLAAIGIAAAAWVMSRFDPELARAKLQVRRLTKRIPKLKAANEDAKLDLQQATYTLEHGAEVSRNNVVTRLVSDKLFSANDDVRRATSEEILQHFRALWRKLVGEEVSADGATSQTGPGSGTPPPSPGRETANPKSSGESAVPPVSGQAPPAESVREALGLGGEDGNQT